MVRVSSEDTRREEYPRQVTITQDRGEVTVSLTDQGCGDPDCLADQIFNSWADPEYSANFVQIQQIKLDAEALPESVREQLMLALLKRFQRPVF